MTESVKQTWQQVCIIPSALRVSTHDYTSSSSSSVLCLLPALKIQDQKYSIIPGYYSKGVVTFQKAMTTLVGLTDKCKQILYIIE